MPPNLPDFVIPVFIGLKLIKYIPMEQQAIASTLGKYTIVRNLGEGATSEVKLGRDPDGREVALKIYKGPYFGEDRVRQEREMMRRLRHPNLVNLLEVIDSGELVDCSTNERYFLGQVRRVVQCIVLEVVGEGELFDYIAIPGRFSEVTARTYFKWLMEGLVYMHREGICHRDIKPENLLLNSEFMLKIADFGFAAFISGTDNSGVLHERLGTSGYMAPEIYLMNYSGTAVDIFAAGVVLFIMVSGHPPFQTAVASDPFFKLIRDQRNQMFWTQHSRRKSLNFYSPAFQNLIDRMLAFDPKDRISMEEIYAHPWFTDKVLNFEEIAAQFSERKAKVKEHLEQTKRQKEEKRSSREKALNSKGTLDRDTEDELTMLFVQLYEKEEQAERELKVVPFVLRKDLVVREKPALFFSTLFTFLHERLTIKCGSEEIELRPTFDINGSQIQVVYVFDYEGKDEQLGIQLSISLTPKHDICVGFKQLSGNDIYYRHVVRCIREEFINREVPNRE